MANALTKFARRNFGERRGFGSKLGRVVRGKNPFVRKITPTSVIARPAGRVVNAMLMEGSDALVLGGVMLVGNAALKAVKAGGKAILGSVLGREDEDSGYKK